MSLSCAHPTDERPANLRQSLWRYTTGELPGELLWCAGVALILTVLISPFWIDGSIRQWLQALRFNLIVSVAIGLAVSWVLRFVMPPLKQRVESPALRMAAQIGFGLAATAVGVEVAVRGVELLGGMQARDIRFDVLRIGLVVVSVILLIELGYERLRERARRDEMKAEQARKEALRAELKALQARTNPHFLFNSLNTVAGLIDDDPAAAERMLERLADLFRYALNSADVGWVRLSEEIEAVRGYLHVESIRLGDRLHSEISIGSEVDDPLVPPLVLQPLVENAVQHAVAPRREGGRIDVRAAIRNSKLHLEVEDDGAGLESDGAQGGTESSLRELRERLRMLYSEAAELRLEQTRSGGLCAIVVLPLESPE